MKEPRSEQIGLPIEMAPRLLITTDHACLLTKPHNLHIRPGGFTEETVIGSCPYENSRDNYTIRFAFICGKEYLAGALPVVEFVIGGSCSFQRRVLVPEVR